MRFDVLPYLYQLYGEVAHEVFPNPPPTYKPKIVNNIIIIKISFELQDFNWYTLYAYLFLLPIPASSLSCFEDLFFD